MEDFLAKEFYGNSFLNWGICISGIIGSIIAGKIIYLISTNYLKKAAAKTKTQLDDILIDMIEEPLVIFLSLLGIKYSLYILILPAEIQKFFSCSIEVLMVCVIGWGLLRIFNTLFGEYLTPLAKSTESVLDDQILSIFRKGINLIIICLTILIAISNAGYNIGTLLAGLGIGGLALALAAQDTVGNFFWGVTIIADKPFKINDRVEVHGHDGEIIDIGLRSTRLRTIGDNRVVTIPNSMFTSGAIKNISSEPSRMIDLNLGLTYDTTVEQMDLAMDILSDIVKKNKHVEKDCITSFNAFNDFALNIKFRYYIKKKEGYFSVQTEINREILKQFNANKLKFAFPTQTIHAELKNK